MHEESPAHQMQTHVVEEMMPEQLTEVGDVKEVINQLIPIRKRKPRTKKRKSENTGKYSKLFKYHENAFSENDFKMVKMLKFAVPRPNVDGVTATNGSDNSQPKLKRSKIPRDPNSEWQTIFTNSVYLQNWNFNSILDLDSL